MLHGIYAMDNLEILGSPKLWPGVCGSALIQMRRAKELPRRWGICGIMHWASLSMKYSTEATHSSAVRILWTR